MTDLETYLKSKLNESIDAELGPRRAAPPFEPPAPSRAWVRPLLAAASVLVVVGGAVVISRDSTSEHGRPGTTNHPQPTTSNHSNPPPLAHAAFHGATIAIPLGWTAHPKQGTPNTLCLSASKAASACELEVRYAAPSGTAMLDVDEPGGFYGNTPQWCAPQPTPARKLTGATVRDFGGRQAQWRTWELDCPSGKKVTDEQFVVPSSPGFALYAHDPTSAVRDAMDTVAQQSQLPAQDAPLWLTDRGRIQSVSSSVQNGKAIVHLVLSRFGPDGTVATPPTLVSYDISQSVYRTGSSPHAGATIYLATDGHTVTLIEKR